RRASDPCGQSRDPQRMVGNRSSTTLFGRGTGAALDCGTATASPRRNARARGRRSTVDALMTATGDRRAAEARPVPFRVNGSVAAGTILQPLNSSMIAIAIV